MEVGTLPDLDFFAKMKALSEQEQDTVGSYSTLPLITSFVMRDFVHSN